MFTLAANSPLSAGVLFVADFDEATTPLDIGSSSAISDVGNGSHTFTATAESTPALGNTGASLKINHTTGGNSYVTLDFGSAQDLTSYRALSFWVRGAAGGEKFQISLKRSGQPAGQQEPGFRPGIQNFLSGSVTTSWQKVVIPLRSLYADFLVATSTPLSDITNVVFTIDTSTPTESFYIDDVLFHTKAAPVWVDNFNDGDIKSAFASDPTDGVNNSSTLSQTLDTATSASSPASLQIVWSTGTTLATFALKNLVMDNTTGNGIGVDISGCDAVALNVKGDSNASGKSLAVAFKRDNNAENGDGSTVTLSTTWQAVSKSLSAFSLGSSTDMAFVEIWFHGTAGTGGATLSNPTGFTINVDDVRLLDTSAPTAPSALADDGTAIANGSFIGVSNAVTFTAGTNGADATLESVRFEHDGLSGGATWYTVFRDTNTSSASHSFTWNTSSLAAGTSYRVRAVALDVAGNETASTVFTGLEVNPSCDVAQAADTAAPALTHTAVSTATADQAVTLSASVTDGTRVARVSLFSRVKGASSYTQSDFTLASACSTSFSGSVSIPASSVTAAGLEYYITATDSLNTASSGSATAPHAILVKETSKRTDVTASGGTVRLEDSNAGDGESSLVIPEGALSEAVRVTFEQKSVSSVPSGEALGRTQPFAAFELGPDGTRFQKPVTLTLLYPDADQDGFAEDPATGANTTVAEKDLRVFVFDGLDWVSLGGAVDSSGNTVATKTTHFSTYAVFPAPAATADLLRPKEKIITPVGSPGVNDTLDFGGTPTGATIDLYDVTGRRIRRLEGALQWDGRDADGDFVESGVYLYQAKIEDQKISGVVTVAR